MRNRDPNSVSGVKIDVAGGSRLVDALHRGLLHDRRRAGAGPRLERRDRAVVGVAHVVERRDVEPAFHREPPQEVVAVLGGANRAGERRNQHLPLARRDHVGEQARAARGSRTSRRRRSRPAGRAGPGPPRAARSRRAASSSRRWCSPTRTRPRTPARRNRRPGSATRGSGAERPPRAAPAAPVSPAGTPARTPRRPDR